MTKPYTPETIDIKMAYVLSFDPEGVHKILANMVAEMTTGHAADFDRWLEKHDLEVKAQALRDAADEMEAEYEERTAKSGAYGQTKIRAALRMGAGMVRNRAARLTATNKGNTDV